VRLLIFGHSVSAVTRELEEYLTRQGYQVLVAAELQAAVEVARTEKPALAFIPATLDEAAETLELMQKLGVLGVPSVLINGDGESYSAAEDESLARAISSFARRSPGNGNGHHS
jgi:hypothetical protein